MSEIRRIDLGSTALLAFRGPDATRYLNGQLTQDVRRVAGGRISLPSCVTDAKGRLQFRVTILEIGDALWVACFDGDADELEARLTRYLIADDVEVTDLTGSHSVHHFTGPAGDAPPGTIVREVDRFGVPGTDWWLPAGTTMDFPAEIAQAEPDELEEMRISHGIPLWGKEILPGMLPPEARLDASDISYNKGCYIGQEVISRIKSAGKVPKLLARFEADAAISPGPLVQADGSPGGEITSVSPVQSGDSRRALGYLRRGATEVFQKIGDDKSLQVRVL